MKPHPYLRAYMAGTLVPTIFVMIIVCVYSYIRYGLRVPAEIEKGMIFPLAFVPNIWGIWNVLYTKVHQRHQWPRGLHGALLPFLLAPMGAMLATVLDVLKMRSSYMVFLDASKVTYAEFAVGFLAVLILYYLVWKHVVGFLNELVGVG